MTQRPALDEESSRDASRRLYDGNKVATHAYWRALQTLREDYIRHGRSLTDAAFVSLVVYRYGHWAIMRQHPTARWLASKVYGLLKFFILNVTKIWIPPQVQIGNDFHIIHAEGSLSIHPDAVIGDRCGVMHNVTIGTNMRSGAPIIGDDVFIGVNSTVLGAIRIGDRVRIGANTAVSTNVPSDSVVIGSPARIYPSRLISAAETKVIRK